MATRKNIETQAPDLDSLARRLVGKTLIAQMDELAGQLVDLKRAVTAEPVDFQSIAAVGKESGPRGFKQFVAAITKAASAGQTSEAHRAIHIAIGRAFRCSRIYRNALRFYESCLEIERHPERAAKKGGEDHASQEITTCEEGTHRAGNSS